MGDPSKHNTFYNHFPTPEYLTLSTSGIAITDEAVHFIELRHSIVGKGLGLSHYEKIILPKGVVESGFINGAEKLTEVLSDLSRRYNLKYTRATLPEERAYLFSATIDKVPTEGLRDAVAFILEENVPVTLVNSVFDFDVVSTSEEAGKLKVTVAVISRKVVDFYLEVFQAADITPVSFDIESQAIARAIVHKGDKSTQLILNLGQNKTGFYVVEDEVVQFTTTLPYGAGDGGAHPHLSDLKMEINKIFTFWSAHNKSAEGGAGKIEKVLLSGPASQDHGFVEELMADTPSPYEWVTPWKNISARETELPPELVKDAQEYISAVGLAIPHPHRTYV